MKITKLPLIAIKLVALILFSVNSYAQVGIGTLEPNASSMLDITSTTKGMLAPRMTSQQRNLIANPVNGLLVYDITENSFYFYKANAWTKMDASVGSRTNYKLIKSVTDLSAELTAGGGSKYLLNTNTLYEINGAIILAHPIELNNAYVIGLDSGEDKLVRLSGNLFIGATGGSVRTLTLVASTGNVFNLSGGTAENLILRDLIVANSNSVGSISNYGMVFMSVVQYVNNNAGITFNTIAQLLLSNTGWFGNNRGTFETYTGAFSLIQKQGGFMAVNGAARGINVSSNPTVETGVLSGVSFNGINAAQYVIGYPAAQTYPGYNFSNTWTVDCPGIPREGDAEATGDINLSAAVGSGEVTTFSNTGTSSRKKITGTTTSNNLFRFTKDGDNRITYKGNKSRYFQVAGSVSYQGTTADMTLILYIAKNGNVLTETKVYGRPSSGWFSTAGILALPVIGTVQLKKDDYIEIWAERYDGSGSISTVSLNLIVR